MNYYRPIIKLVLIGYDAVAENLIWLLNDKSASLPFSPAIIGIFSRELGFRWQPGKPLLPEELLQRMPASRRVVGGMQKFIERVDADVLLEFAGTTGEAASEKPATSTIEDGLRAGKHIITTNALALALHYRKLYDLAQQKKLRLRFEAAVANGLPIFSFRRYTLPATRVQKIRAVLNSSANYVLQRMAAGLQKMNALAEARAAGIGIAGSEHDLNGWDSAVKASVLAHVFMGPLSPHEVVRDHFDQRAADIIARAARSHGKPQQVVRIEKTGEAIKASVRLQVALPDDPLFALSGFDLGIVLETDTLGRLVLLEKAPSLQQKAFTVLSDLFDVYYRGILPQRQPTLFDIDQDDLDDTETQS